MKKSSVLAHVDGVLNGVFISWAARSGRAFSWVAAPATCRPP